MKKINKNRRIVPTDDDLISNKSFSLETFLKLQVESKWSKSDIHRYIDVENINYSVWAGEISTDVKTLKKNICLLEKIGVIKRVKVEGSTYLKLSNKFDRYILFDVRFLDKLLSIGSKNLIKVYMIYYKYTVVYGYSSMSKSDILKQLGLNSNSNKNKQMLKDINDTLVQLGLIIISTRVKYGSLKTKTVLEIVAISYQKTEFFQTALDLKNTH